MLERLKTIRKILKINQTTLAQQLGITQTAYSTIENGMHPLCERNIKLICELYNINEVWFRTGEGDMFLPIPCEKEFTETFSMLSPSAQQYVFAVAKQLLKAQNKSENNAY